MSQFYSDARAMLEGRGYHLTGPRAATLRVVAELGDTFSAEDLCRRAPGMARATVYRTLRLLLEAGLVCRVAMADGRRRYSMSSAHHHHHLVCLRCGSVRDFSRDALEEVLDRVSRVSGYDILGHRIELYGVCPSCLGAQMTLGEAPAPASQGV